MRTMDYGIAWFGNTMTAVVRASLFVWKWARENDFGLAKV